MMTASAALMDFLDERSLEFLEYDSEDHAGIELDLRHEVVLCEPLAGVLARSVLKRSEA
jgi:hypothetical protein